MSYRYSTSTNISAEAGGHKATLPVPVPVQVRTITCASNTVYTNLTDTIVQFAEYQASSTVCIQV